MHLLVVFALCAVDPSLQSGPFSEGYLGGGRVASNLFGAAAAPFFAQVPSPSQKDLAADPNSKPNAKGGVVSFGDKEQQGRY